MPSFFIRAANENDRPFIREFIARRWYGEAIIVHGEFFYPAELPGFVAMKDQRVLGLVTYHIRTPECEIITLDSLAEGMGIGSQLIQAVKKTAVEAGCICLTLITTNDNLESLGFYQKRGFRIRTVYPSAVERAREFKPSIPRLGNNGIPIRDEIQLEMNL